MQSHVTRCAAVSAIVVMAPLMIEGGCPPATFQSTLPEDLPASVRHVVSHALDFEQDAGALPGPDVVDDLTNVAGCWGAVVRAVAGEGTVGQMDWYSLLHFEPGGGLTTWDVVDNGGLLATVYAGTGRYEVVSNNCLRLSIERRQYYNPLTRAYEVFDNQAEVTEYLATLDDDKLCVRAPDPLGEPGSVVADAEGTLLYRRFDCPD